MLYRFLLLLFVVLPSVALGQRVNKQGLKEYFLLDKGDTVRFYIYNPGRTHTDKIFLYLQGSGARPLISRTDSVECCFNNYPKKEMQYLAKQYAVLYIHKIGVPYYANTDHYTPSAAFDRRNDVLERAEVANKVLNYVTRYVYKKPRVVAVLGHSEGSDVAARLAVLNKKVTHLCFAAGNGTPQVFNDILFTRRNMHAGKITPQQANEQINKLLVGLDSVYKNNKATDRKFNGDTYKWHYAINKPAVDNLLQLKIPIYLTIGSNDTSVPVEASDYIAAEFVRARKTNLVYKVYENCTHSYVEQKPDGTEVSRWLDLFQDFSSFIDKDLAAKRE